MPDTRGRGQGGAQRLDRRRTVGAGDDDLGQHRVVVRRDVGAALYPGVDAGNFGPDHLREQAGAGLKAGVRHLGVEPRLDRCATRHYRPPGKRRADRILPGRLPDHPFHEIVPEDSLGDGVLDLESRVDL